MKEELLRLEQVCCAEGDAQELIFLNMQVFVGEIYGILELESYGISKLVELLCRNTPIQIGQIFFEEKLVNSARESDGSRNKVEVIGRKNCLIDSLSLSDNLFVMRERFKGQLIAERAMRIETNRILKKVGISLPAEKRAEDLTRYQRIVLEVLKAVIDGARLIILWDISDMLSAEELPRFHNLLKKLAGRGSTFIYINGHHELLSHVCERIAVFKEQTIKRVIYNQDVLRDQILNVYARHTYNKLLRLRQTTENEISGNEVIRLEHVSYDHLHDFNFSVSAGEIILLLDQSNTIIDELPKLLIGKECPESGRILPEMREKERIKKVALVERDAVHTTLLPELSYLENLCLPLAEKVPFFWQRPRLKRSVFYEYKNKVGPAISASNLYELSKKELLTLVYYRVLIARPEMVVCVQPISNMDMHLRGHVLELMTELRSSGIAVLVLNTELYDTFYIANKLIQVENGHIICEYASEYFDEARKVQSEIFPD